MLLWFKFVVYFTYKLNLGVKWTNHFEEAVIRDCIKIIDAFDDKPEIFMALDNLCFKHIRNEFKKLIVVPTCGHYGREIKFFSHLHQHLVLLRKLEFLVAVVIDYVFFMF